MTARNARKHPRRWVPLIALLLAGALAAPASAGARSRSGTIDYWETDNHVSQNANIDADDFGFTAIAGTGEGRSKLGSVTHSWLTEVDSIPADLDECSEDAVLGLRFFFNSSVRVYRNGDRLHAQHNPDAPGYICFFADGTAVAKIEQIVVGGTGRFDGATGTLTSELTTVNLMPRGLETTSGEFWGPGSWTTKGSIALVGS